MKKTLTAILILISVFGLSFCRNKNKNETNYQEPIVVFQQNRDSLIIEGNKIWIRELPKTGKVVFKLDSGEVCYILEKGEQQIIRGDKDYWYKIDHYGKIGWVFGSQSSIKQNASADNFEPFLEYFLQTCFFNQNMDSLIYFKAPSIIKYVHPKIKVGRMYNPGVACVPFGYHFYDNGKEKYYGQKYPALTGLKMYANQSPKDGFCEESPDPDGIYYQEIKDMPKYPDMETDDYKVLEYELPGKYKEGLKIKVDILHGHWIIKTMYFIAADGKWWLMLINDCDCSA